MSLAITVSSASSSPAVAASVVGPSSFVASVSDAPPPPPPPPPQRMPPAVGLYGPSCSTATIQDCDLRYAAMTAVCSSAAAAAAASMNGVEAPPGGGGYLFDGTPPRQSFGGRHYAPAPFDDVPLAGASGAADDGGEPTIVDLEPIPRDRCNTWPLRRPNLDPAAAGAQLIHERIDEEENSVEDEEELCDLAGDLNGSVLDYAALSPGDFHGELSPRRADSSLSGLLLADGLGGSGALGGSDSPPSSKKSTTRRNAWGNMSYADLITQAILNSPEKRLTLSQVYEWMVQNVPYFRDKGDSNSSAGWKNSIRHNLSLHSRFMRIQNEGAGKSSWWVINPEAKPGRNPRRRAATLEAAAAKVIIDKKRRGAKKRLELGGGPPGAGGSPFCRGGLPGAGGGGTALSSTTSLLQQDLYADFGLADNFSQFRPRTQSVLSVASSRMSPAPGPPEPPGFEDFKFPFPEPEPAASAGGAATSNGPVTEILSRTDQMRLEPGSQSAATAATAVHASVNGTKMESQPTTQAQTRQNFTAPQAVEVKTEMTDNVSNSGQDDAGVTQPPSYQELNAVRPGVQIPQNPLLRSSQLQRGSVPTTTMKSEPKGFAYFSNNMMFSSNQTPPAINFNVNLHSAPWPLSQAAGAAVSGASAASNSFLSSPALSQMAGAPPPLSTYLPYSSCAAGAFNAFPTTVSAGMGLAGGNGIADGLVGAATLAGNASAGGNMVHLPMDLQNLSMNHSMMEVDVDELLRYDLRMDAQQQGAAGQGPYRFDLP